MTSQTTPAVDAPALTCATCKHIGRQYWDNGYSKIHFCGKSDQRRQDQMPKGADFFDHFRAFFDASAKQAACKYYEEREIAAEPVIALLKRIDSGDAEFKFFSNENYLAGSLARKFIESDEYKQSNLPRNSGSRVYKLLPVGRCELDRVGVAHE